MGNYTLTNPAGSLQTVLAQGHALAPGETLPLSLDQMRVGTIKLVDDGDLTSAPAIPDFVLEAAKGVGREAKEFNGPITNIMSGLELANTRALLRHATYGAERATEVVVEGSDSPQAAATGVRVRFVLRDAGGDDDYSNSGFGFRVTAVGVGSLPAAGITVTPDPENVDPDRVGTANSPFVLLRAGKACVTITAVTPGDVDVDMQEATRALTITDETQVSLT